MISLTLEGSVSEIRDAMRAFLGGEVHAPAETPSPKAAPKTTVKRDAPPATPPAAPSKTAEPTLADCSAKVSQLLTTWPRAKVVEFLATFGVKKASELQPAQWADFLTQADALA